MTIGADASTHVVGVDTHAAAHRYAVIDTRTGGTSMTRSSPPTPFGLADAGYDRLRERVAAHCHNPTSARSSGPDCSGDGKADENGSSDLQEVAEGCTSHDPSGCPDRAAGHGRNEEP
jgi:hypothetical protein